MLLHLVGSDRNNTLYCFFPFYPVGLFAETMCEEALVDDKQEVEEGKDVVNLLEAILSNCKFLPFSQNSSTA